MIEGRGLHRGERASVRLSPAPGPVTLNGVRVAALHIDAVDRSTTVNGIGTVEHLFAALEARSIREGVAIAVEGPELPLVDGGAAAFCDALRELPDLAPGPRPTIVQSATIDGYTFAPGPAVRVEVAIDFADARIAPEAAWDGDAADFRTRIAPARTFAFERDLGPFLERGLAQHVTPESVVLFTADRILVAGAAFAPDEPARHKLLDLLGDLYLHGGAPIGTLRALRPGHARTHDVMRRALHRGVVRAMIPG